MTNQTNVKQLLTDNLDIWLSAETAKISGRGRASSNKGTVFGVQKLRELILELAVRGKLVPQNASDEPASELLKRIQSAKTKLIAEGKLKKEKSLASVGEDEKPFELPSMWEWVRLSDLVNILNGRAYKKEELLSEGTPVLRVGNLFTSDTWYYSNLELEEVKYCNKGDLLFAWSASFGPFIWDGERSIYHYHIWKLDFYAADLPYKKFLYTFLLEQTQKIKSSGHGVMMVHMTKEAMERLVVYLPPLAEQHRIVAKVDELMSLCDQLSTRIDQASQQQQLICDAFVAQAVLPQSAEVLDLTQYRKALACYTIKKMCNKPAFGRTQAMKLLYLAQHHVGLNLQLQFEREAAGPLARWIYEFERQGEREQWFKVAEKAIGAGKIKVEYRTKSAIAAPAAMIESLCSIQERKELDRLFELFADKNTEEAEIIATLYAAWNDFLIEGQAPEDEQIIKEVRENWHPRKARFTPEELQKYLGWLRRNHIVPQGRLPRTIYQKQLVSH